MPSQKTLGLIAICLVLTAFAITVNTVPPLVTTMAREFDVPVERFGYGFSMQFLTFALASWTGGFFVARLGGSVRTLIAIGLAMMSVLFVFGAALKGPLAVTLWFLPLGYAGGLSETFAAVMINQLSGPNSSKLMNLSQAFYCGGAILAPQVVAILLDAGIDWRWAMILLGGFSAAITVTFVLFTRHIAAHATAAEKERLAENDRPNDADRDRLLTNPLFRWMAMSLFLYVAVEASIVCWLAAYFEKFLFCTSANAAHRLSIFWIGLIVGRAAMLVLPMRWTMWPAMLIGAIGMLIGCGLMCTEWSAWAATAIVVITGIAFGPVWSAIVVLSQAVSGSQRFTSGVIGAGAMGACMGPLVTKFAVGEFGFASLFPTLTAMSLALLIAAVMARWRTHTAA